MFSPNVINGVLQSRFDEITTHLNHQLSFSPLSNKGHVLVDDNFYDFEVDNEGHVYSPQQLEGYDFYGGKSYLGHYNDMNFSPTAPELQKTLLFLENSGRGHITNIVRKNLEDYGLSKKPEINDSRTAKQLSQKERLAEMRFIIEAPSFARSRADMDIYFLYRNKDYNSNPKFIKEYDIITEIVRNERKEEGANWKPKYTAFEPDTNFSPPFAPPHGTFVQPPSPPAVSDDDDVDNNESVLKQDVIQHLLHRDNNNLPLYMITWNHVTFKQDLEQLCKDKNTVPEVINGLTEKTHLLRTSEDQDFNELDEEDQQTEIEDQEELLNEMLS